MAVNVGQDIKNGNRAVLILVNTLCALWAGVEDKAGN